MIIVLFSFRDNFPGIIGAIDCTHIRIECPGRRDAQRFYNRKHFYSFNVQVGLTFFFWSTYRIILTMLYRGHYKTIAQVDSTTDYILVTIMLAAVEG